MKFRNAILKIQASQGKKQYVLVPDQSNSFDELYVDFQRVETGAGWRYTLFLHPKEDLVVEDLAVEFACDFAAFFFANGVQSWSESRLLPVQTEIPRLKKIARPFLSKFGDEEIAGIPHGAGILHSWTFTYIQDATGNKTFFGSLAEHTGFTLYVLDQTNQTLIVRKEMQGLHLSHSFPCLDFLVGQGSALEEYFNLMEVPKSQQRGEKTSLGWTSWNRVFTNISEEPILKNLEAVAESGLPFRYFQIDDGWQTAVGDWRSVKQSFPNGMQHLAHAIREKNLLPGLWLAPFIAAKKSELVKKHPEWLLKNEQGKAIRVGWNSHWGGWFYALDFYHSEVRDYLSGVFHVVLEKWGFEMLKLDYLFAVCLQPPREKTRGQVMHEAMEFLHKQLGGREMLASGVPLASTFGLADFCSIAPEIHLAWESRLPTFLHHRERHSTLSALRTTLGRWDLNGKAFFSDPGLFVLGKEKQNLSPVQQNTLLTINALFGSLLLTPDNIEDYGPEQYSELEEALSWAGSPVKKVSQEDLDIYRIEFENDGKQYVAHCNLRQTDFEVEDIKNGRIRLRPFETIILKQVN